MVGEELELRADRCLVRLAPQEPGPVVLIAGGLTGGTSRRIWPSAGRQGAHRGGCAVNRWSSSPRSARSGVRPSPPRNDRRSAQRRTVPGSGFTVDLADRPPRRSTVKSSTSLPLFFLVTRSLEPSAVNATWSGC